MRIVTGDGIGDDAVISGRAPAATSLLPRTRYTRVAIMLHWSIAALILFNLTTGWIMDSSPPILRRLHFSAGLTVLALTGLRLIWRALHEPPPLDAGLNLWERFAARLVHMLLYAAMILMPLLGWAVISANPPPGSAGAIYAAQLPKESETKAPNAAQAVPSGPKREIKARKRAPFTIWGIIPMPWITPLQQIGATPEGVPAQRRIHDDFVRYHIIGAFLLLGLLFLHIAGALKHQWFDGYAELQRMGFGTRKHGEAARSDDRI